ncbi:hypothetical protein [Methylobacterium gnaphalii]|uniref:Uncharacterized protein n=1 Tax=Methylobacterium gnaphalii TaxID=1010610 RepID=A0A512JP67_9HYPH|nr:hypothetical protein [Methylobacterium gnaphalii]GEP11754.1 hypothetical protein MGN01_35990 [Methylobacterium gnaphalii]GJD69432.1 hypothetical protein MMMDOFMJ_2363 [Methylobacterium gnaphalii]GLS49611.1 hypothetical protein GCM10007885_24600 [Methylobacterium gnaphalii]
MAKRTHRVGLATWHTVTTPPTSTDAEPKAKVRAARAPRIAMPNPEVDVAQATRETIERYPTVLAYLAR